MRHIVTWSRWAGIGMAAAVLSGLASPAKADLMLIGNDMKVFWDENAKQGNSAPGHDSVLVVDVKDRMNPRVVVSLPLMNSVFGPPVNLAITPDESLAIVANSMDWVKDGENWKPAPDNKLFVIDLKASPPALIDTVTVGKQPSGLAINRAGTLATNLNSVVEENHKQIRDVLLDLGRSLLEARQLIMNLNDTLDSNRTNLDESLENIRVSSQNLKQFTDTIKQRPFSLIRIKAEKDRVPPGGKLLWPRHLPTEGRHPDQRRGHLLAESAP